MVEETVHFEDATAQVLAFTSNAFLESFHLVITSLLMGAAWALSVQDTYRLCLTPHYNTTICRICVSLSIPWMHFRLVGETNRPGFPKSHFPTEVKCIPPRGVFDSCGKDFRSLLASTGFAARFGLKPARMDAG